MATLSLIARLGLNKSGFDAGISAATKQVTNLGSDLKGALAGAFSIAAVTAFVRSINEATGRIKDLSEQFGITTEEVQRADFALKQSGLAFEDLGTAMLKIGQSRKEAVEGNKELRDTFERYKITLQDLRDPQQRNYDLIMRIAKAISGMNVTAKEQTEIQDLLGAKAGKLANVLKDLENTKPPALFTDQDIDQIDKATKAMAAFKLEAQAAVAPLQAKVFGLLRAYLAALREVSVEGGKVNFQKADAKFMEIIGERDVNPIGNALGQGVENFFRGLINAGAGPLGGVNKPDNQLFELDKNAGGSFTKTRRPDLFSGSPIQSDSLGRIGAFSGGGQQATITNALKRHTEVLTQIKQALTERGIKIKDL